MAALPDLITVQQFRRMQDDGRAYELHVEVGQKDVGSLAPYLGECGKSIFRRPNFIPRLRQDSGQQKPKLNIVFHNQDILRWSGQLAPPCELLNGSSESRASYSTYLLISDIDHICNDC